MSTQVITTQAKGSIYQTIILNILQKMTKGRLNLSLPDGSQINIGDGIGTEAYLSISNTDFFRKCVLYGDVGFGEAYVAGDWNTDNIKKVINWFLLNIENVPDASGSKSNALGVNIFKVFNKISHLFRANNIEGSRRNISQHYDLNNAFFKLFLDETMTYSSAYFNRSDLTLEEAQFEKYDRLCRELYLKETDHVLEIGCGWGGMCIHIAKNYGCRVTTITISEEQYRFAKDRIETEGLEHLIDIQLKDYRLLEGRYSKIVSIEMLEAVGHKFLDVYFKKVSDLLEKNGLLALQVITCPDSRYESLRKGVDWIQKYIFPGSLLPSVAAINGSINKTSDLSLVNLKDLGIDYARTLNIWASKFNSALNEVKALGFDESFIRKWNYYLEYCEAAFESRNINVMQLVYSRPNNTNY